jgi:radical SAM protein with 4Fe4S-binding SPASM domain
VRPFLHRCLAGLAIAGVMADGGIGACPELSRSFLQGHISRDRLRTVWEQRYEVFRERSWTRRGVCAECGVYGRCQGDGLHLRSDPGAEVMRCMYRMLRA